MRQPQEGFSLKIQHDTYEQVEQKRRELNQWYTFTGRGITRDKTSGKWYAWLNEVTLIDTHQVKLTLTEPEGKAVYTIREEDTY